MNVFAPYLYKKIYWKKNVFLKKFKNLGVSQKFVPRKKWVLGLGIGVGYYTQNQTQNQKFFIAKPTT